jgi:glycosyltransferase involved in cell wall biosynthesis
MINTDEERMLSRGGKPKLEVLYVQPGTTSFAGIERVIDTICTELSEKYHGEIAIDVLYTSLHHNRPVERRAYHVIEELTHSRSELLRAYRRVIGAKKYDLVVVPQVEPTVICMVACIGIKRKFALYLHGNPSRERSHWKAKLLFMLMKVVFLDRVSYVFGTSPRQLDSFKLMFGSKVRQAWLPNPVRRFDVEAAKPVDQEQFVTFVNVGRFSYQKGQDILLNAFQSLSQVRKNVKLKIIGYGAAETELREQVKRLNLESLVAIEHQPDSPHLALAASDIYVSTSRWEGWSLAICEALRFGMPVISTDCEFGPSDILTDRRLGQLVPVNGREALVDSMIYYCDNLTEEACHSEFRKTYIARFNVESVVDVHAKALLAAVK